ncbi:hypothetical protein EVAR_65199_1 [Eumeta japonica]|uniref:Uncharacterized protein n=1 Tax=Eumeta variegata TaxID=151549 RepID=A0A4C1ZII3_EUMVA|nr:hypothetical protein EVAR_65199_1 [Eumeta japonica]
MKIEGGLVIEVMLNVVISRYVRHKENPIINCEGVKGVLYEEGGEYRCVGARPPDLHRLRELKRVTLRVTGECRSGRNGASRGGR